MEVRELGISGVKLITPKRWRDERGFFSETYSVDAFRAAGVWVDFVQDNHSLSSSSGTIRGLHFQIAPFEQAKLVRVTRGRILDVAVDLRRSSPSYKQHLGVELSAENWSQLFIPTGFAHGFCTLTPDAEVVYKVSSRYSHDHDRGVRWNDPALNINWPVSEGCALLSSKDSNMPFLSDLPGYFD